MIDVKKEKNETTFYLYGTVGTDFTDAEFNRELIKVSTPILNVRVNSPGGNVFMGYAIYNRLKAFKGTVNTYIDGIAASMASIIVLSGKKIYMAENAMYMIHNPSSPDPKANELLSKVKAEMIKTYSLRTRITANELDLLLSKETWYNSTDAKNNGFIDEIVPDVFHLSPKALHIAAMSHKAIEVYNQYKLIKNQNEMDLQKILSRLKLGAEATEEDILAAIDALLLEVENAKADKSENEEAQAEAISAILRTALQAKKIFANDVPHYEALLKKDFKNTSAVIANMQGFTKPSEQLIHNALDFSDNGTVTTINGKSKALWTLEDYRKHAPLDLERNPKLYAQLCEKAGITNDE